MNPLWIRAIEASAGAVPPYLAGGAPDPFAVYAPMLAGSLAESYLRIAGTGGNANLDPAVVGSGVAPTHTPGVGWGMNGINTYLDTGLIPLADWTMLIRYSGWSVLANRELIGSSTNILLQPSNATGTGVVYAHGSVQVVSPAMAGGVLAIAGPNGYRNGTLETSAAGSSNAIASVRIGNARSSSFFQGFVQYVIFYDASTDHATWLPAVSAAVAAL